MKRVFAMAIFKKMRGFNFGLVLAVLLDCAMGVQSSEATDYSVVSPLRIIDTIPQPDAGIINSARVHDDTSFAVLIETEQGINLNDPDSIRFLISDGEFGLYERNLISPSVRLVEVARDPSRATLVWAVYDRSLDPMLPPVYALDTIVNIFVEVEDLYQNEISGTAGRFKFKIESDSEQAHAFNNLPESVFFNTENPIDIHDSGIEIVSGVLTGARILYNANEPLLPAFGPMDEIEPLALGGEQAVGSPLNLMPHTVFNRPLKLYIPFPEATDITSLDIYYHNGVQWLAACDVDGNILPGGEGWMVPGSRVNHPEQSPPQIEIEVYHFSAAQAVVSGTSTTTGNTHHEKSGSGAVVYVSCFIDTAASESITVFNLLSLLVPIIFATLFSYSFFKKLINVLTRSNIVNFYGLIIASNLIDDPESFCTHRQIAGKFLFKSFAGKGVLLKILNF
jgi:hypothetical protein